MEIIVDLITPFDESNKIDKIALDKLLEKLLLENAGSIAVNGLGGEVFSLEYQEKTELLRHVSKYSEYFEIYSGLSEKTIEENYKFIMETDVLDFYAYIIYLKQFDNLPLSEIYNYISEIKKITEKKIILFNNELEEISLKNLKEQKLDGIIFQKIKHDFQDIAKFSQEEKLKAFLGNETQLYDAWENKMDGILSSSANYYFKEFLEIITLDDYERFLVYQEKIKKIQTKAIPIVIKALLNEFEFPVGSVRLPLEDLHFYEKECYFKKLKQM